jgi:heat shock protein HslJ
MASMALPVTVMAVAMIFGHAAAGWPQEKTGSWLDQAKPSAWNKTGAAIPVAPRIQGAIDPRCREAARPPQLNEDQRVREQGWELVGAYQGGWEMLVIGGTAGYDGMCRPRQYQDFVFVRGTFAGTLSPQPMDSRTDGALQRVTLQSATQLTAEYARYAAKDALCCPSRTTRVVFDAATDGVLRPMSASTSANQPSASTPSPGLGGTSWQLVRFQGSDDTTLTPDDRAKYTIEFAGGGQLTARVDCNRGRGTWTSTGASQIAFGPLALTRALCPPGSLHDHVVKQWGHIRSYVVKDGHLFLSLMADGGIYEFEPAR